MSFSVDMNQDKILQVKTELDALEKTPINGWDTVYPTLFQTLQTSVEQISKEMGCPPPPLVIRFDLPNLPMIQSLQSYQASAFMLNNGATQLHLGSNFIRTFLLAPEAAERPAMEQAFRWSIAHEIGHLSDSLFHTYAKSYSLRAFFDLLTTTMCIGGAAHLLFPNQFAFFSLPIFLTALLLKALKKGGLIILHRSLEYRADKIALQYPALEVNPAAAHRALQLMTIHIKHRIERDKGSNLLHKLQIFYYKINSFLLHPSIEKRMHQMKKGSK